MSHFLTPILLILSGFGIFAQETVEKNDASMGVASINASGGNATGIRGSVAYSIGVINYTHIESSDNMVSQGVQHSEPLDGGEDTESDVARIIGYPNPTTNYVVVDIIDYKDEPTQYQIFSPSGIIMKTGLITAKTTRFNTENWSDAIYFIRVSVFNEFEETLKIVKL